MSYQWLDSLDINYKCNTKVPVDLGAAAVGAESEVGIKIKQQLVLLKQKVGETGAELDKCKSEQEQFSVEYYACRENSNRLTALQQQHGEQHQQVKALKTQKETIIESKKLKTDEDDDSHIIIEDEVRYIIIENDNPESEV